MLRCIAYCTVEYSVHLSRASPTLKRPRLTKKKFIKKIDSYCKDMLSFLRIRIPRFEPDREVNK
jgi:hypothetical protein